MARPELTVEGVVAHIDEIESETSDEWVKRALTIIKEKVTPEYITESTR
jgi:hypothetical protein